MSSMTPLVKSCLLSLWCNLIIHTYAEPHYSFDRYDVANLQEAIHRVASEKMLLRERASELLAQKAELDTTMKGLNTGVSFLLALTQSAQNSNLRNRQVQIKELLHRLGDVVARVEGAKAMADRNHADVLTNWAKIDEFTSDSNLEQTALLEKANVILRDSNHTIVARRDELVDELAGSMMTTQSDMQNGLDSALNEKKCYTDFVSVDVDPVLAEGVSDLTFPGSFPVNGNIPTALCGIQGIKTRVELDNKGYDDYGYADEVQSSAVTVDCQPLNDRVEVRVFDQSRGKGNRVETVFIEVRACTFPGLASLPVESSSWSSG